MSRQTSRSLAHNINTCLRRQEPRNFPRFPRFQPCDRRVTRETRPAARRSRAEILKHPLRFLEFGKPIKHGTSARHPAKYQNNIEDLVFGLGIHGKMCKHILNAQVSIRSPCCKQWFDCAQCHADTQTHTLKQTMEMVFACKKCKKCFRKNMDEFEDSDEYCPHCDNHFLLEAKEPQARLEVEGDDVRIDSRMIKDERVKGKEEVTIWDDEGEAARLG